MGGRRWRTPRLPAVRREGEAVAARAEVGRGAWFRIEAQPGSTAAASAIAIADRINRRGVRELGRRQPTRVTLGNPSPARYGDRPRAGRGGPGTSTFRGRRPAHPSSFGFVGAASRPRRTRQARPWGGTNSPTRAGGGSYLTRPPEGTRTAGQTGRPGLRSQIGKNAARPDRVGRSIVPKCQPGDDLGRLPRG